MKKIYSILIAALLTTGTYAQWTSNWLNAYQHTTAINFSNEGRKVAVDAQGNVFTLSDVTSNLDNNNIPVGTTQYYVVLQKYDFSGNPLFKSVINVGGMVATGFTYKSAFALSLDATGNVYIGYTRVTAGAYNVEVAKYTNGLIPSWTHTYNPIGNDYGVDMSVSSGVVFCVVKSVGANTTYAIVRIAGSGTSTAPLYSFVPNIDVVNKIVVGGSRLFYVAGYSLISAVQNAMVAKVSYTPASAGYVLNWKSTFNNGSTTGNDYNTNIIIGTDNKLYTLGTTYTSVANGTDGMVLRYNTNGVFEKYFGMHQGSLADVGGAIANGATGLIYAASSNATSVSVNKIQLSNFQVIGAATYSPVPASQYTALTKVSVNEIKIAASGNAYVTGGVLANAVTGNFSVAYLAKFGVQGFSFRKLNSLEAEADFGQCNEGMGIALDPSHNNNILWLQNSWLNNTNHASEFVNIESLASGGALRMGENVLADVNAANAVQTSFYPNPAKGTMYVSSNQKISKVEVTDAIGKTVATLYPAINGSINISTLKAGVYFAKVITANATEVKRIVVN